MYMRLALDQAKTALAEGEFPVGCVLVAGGRVIATGRRAHSRGAAVNELDHAEIVALRQLDGTGGHPAQVTAYSTMEPCLMCFGALLLAGVTRIVYALEDVMGGVASSLDCSRLAPLYRDAAVSVVSGVCRQDALILFTDFSNNPRNSYWQGSLLARHILAESSRI